MNEHSHEDHSSEPPSDHMLGILKKIQQQLAFLEKKIDTLIAQSAEKPFKEKRFSKPFRPGGFKPGGFKPGGFKSGGFKPGGFNRDRDRERGPRKEHSGEGRPPFERGQSQSQGGPDNRERGRKAFFKRRHS